MAQIASGQAYTIGRTITQATVGTAQATLYTCNRKRGVQGTMLVVNNYGTASTTFEVLLAASHVATASGSAQIYASGATIASAALPIYLPLADLASGDIIRVKAGAASIAMQLTGYERA